MNTARPKKTWWDYCNYCETDTSEGCSCHTDRGPGIPNGECCYCEMSPCRCGEPEPERLETSVRGL